jgi:hypothetical protein
MEMMDVCFTVDLELIIQHSSQHNSFIYFKRVFIVVSIIDYMFWVHLAILTCSRQVTQICIFTLQLCRMGDANLRF